MTKYLISIVVLAAAFFAVGRCTAPVPYVSRSGQIDTLERRVHSAESREIALRKAAGDAYARGLAAQAKKPALVIRYIHDTTRLHAYKKVVRDSLVRLLLTGDARDSSEFTFEAVNGVLDLSAKLGMLTSADSLDMETIANLKTGYLTLDSALCECRKKSSAQSEEVVILKKEVKRQRLLKWLFAGTGLIVGLIK